MTIIYLLGMLLSISVNVDINHSGPPVPQSPHSPVNQFSSSPVQPASDSLTVYIFLHDQCMISQYYTPQLTEYYNEYHGKKIGFAGYFPGLNTGYEEIDAFGRNFRLAFPLMKDMDQEMTRRFGIKVTPEIAVWDHGRDRLIYRGRIDDSYVRVGKRKLHVHHSDLADLIDGWLKGDVPEHLIETQAVGCVIALERGKGRE